MATVTPPLVLIRADACAATGTGHVVRCSALAAALRRRGWRVALATARETSAFVTVPPVDDLLLLDERERNSAKCLTRRFTAIDLMVIDHYGLDSSFASACRDVARRILVIDDLAESEHDADILLNQNFGCSRADYAGLVHNACRLLLGPHMALLGPRFIAAHAAARKRRRRPGAVKRVLVSFGGTDPANATSLALDVLEKLDKDVVIDVVLGPSAPFLTDIRRRCAGRKRLQLHVATRKMPELMLSADLSIGAGGSTTWERLCLGLPTVCMTIADNQVRMSRALAAAGLLRLVERPNHAALDAAVGMLADDAPARLDMSRNGMALVDGNGASRVAEAVVGSSSREAPGQ